LVEYFGSRPQVQERFTEQLQKAMQHLLEIQDVAVVVDGVHFCVRSRGIKDSSSVTRTSALGVKFFECHKAREEFFSSIPSIRDFKLESKLSKVVMHNTKLDTDYYYRRTVERIKELEFHLAEATRKGKSTFIIKSSIEINLHLITILAPYRPTTVEEVRSLQQATNNQKTALAVS
jgi:hypothetical protein